MISKYIADFRLGQLPSLHEANDVCLLRNELAQLCLMVVNANCSLRQAIAAILQDDTSAIVTLKSSGLDRPSKLDGR